MHLTIMNITDNDGGDYYCHAENAYGRDTKVTSLETQPVLSVEPTNMRGISKFRFC